MGSQSSDPARPSSYPIPGDLTFPEGIAPEPGTTQFYVTATSDGTVYRGDVRFPRMTEFSPAGLDGRTTQAGLKSDGQGNLVIAGGDTGKVFVLSTADGSTKKVLDAEPGAFLNDVAISNGYAYITDSVKPVLYRVPVTRDSIGEIEAFRRFEDTPFVYDPDPAAFNANGIVVDPSDSFAIIAQSVTGQLFHLDLHTRIVSEVETGGPPLTNGDGLLLEGDTLYVSRYLEELIHAVALSPDGRKGRVGEPVTGPQLRTPTTIMLDGDRLLAVNSQFDKRAAKQPPELPFDIAVIAPPERP
jgi:sugar lactone lactonase YvrE